MSEITPLTHEHHPAGPSQLGRIQLCAGSYHMTKKARELQMVPEAGDEAAEGTYLHSLIPILDGDMGAATPEQQTLVLKFREYVTGIWARLGTASPPLNSATNIFYEFPMEVFYQSAIIQWGTADLVADCGDYGVVIDAKFGYAELESEIIEPQIRSYSCGLLQKFPQWKYVLAYVFDVRSGTEFTGRYENPHRLAEEIAETIEYAKQHPEVLEPSPTACKYCAGKLLCPAFKAKVIEHSLVTTDPMTLTDPDQLALALELCTQVESWADNMRQVAKLQIINGRIIPGWELRERRNRQVPDILKLTVIAQDHCTESEFLRCCSVSLPVFEALMDKRIKQLYPELDKKGRKEKIAEIFKGAIVTVITTFLARQSRRAIEKPKG